METGVKWSGVFAPQVRKGSWGGSLEQAQKVVSASHCVCRVDFGTCREGGRLLARHKLEEVFLKLCGWRLKGMPSFFKCEYLHILFLVI